MSARLKRATPRRFGTARVHAIESLERRDCPALAISAVVPPRPTVTISDVVVMEGNSRTTQAALMVSLSTATTQSVSVPFSTTDGSATGGNDFTAKTGTLVFSPGQRSKLLVLDVIADQSLEADETFTVTLGNPTNATLAKGIGQVTIRNDDIARPGFQIDLDYDADVPQTVRVAMALAAKRWERVIVGDVPTYIANGLVVDDFRMQVRMGLLGGGDAPGNRLADAGPRLNRSNGLPATGEAGIDPFDVPSGNASRNQQFVGTLTHELGHGLGFVAGGIFSQFVTANSFTGPSAVAEYQRMFRLNATSIPLENGGGGGTAGSHWEEDIFSSELMTGYVAAVMQLSRVTVAAFQDLGYQVSFSGADPFAPSAAAIAAAKALASQPMAAAFAQLAAGGIAAPATPNRLRMGLGVSLPWRV